MELDNIINNFNYSYRNNYNNFIIWKRKINSPNENLKEYQYLIKDYLEKKYTFPFFVTWYRKWLSVNNNASIHIWKKYIMNLDIKNFFWSITRKMLYEEFKNITKDIDMFLDYITYQGVLPQWPPSSPIISNIIFKRIDNIIKKWLTTIEWNITYSRYVDDISIWFDNYDKRYSLFQFIQKILLQNWFALNKEKIKLFEHNKKLYVTWMIINEDSAWIWYKKYKRAKKIIYLYLKFNTWYFPYIKGLLLYIKWVDYKRYEQLKNYYFDEFSLEDNYKELFWIDKNWKKIIKDKLNKFNRDFNYLKPKKEKRNPNKKNRFSTWRAFLEDDYDIWNWCWIDDDLLSKIINNWDDDDRWYSYL